MVDERADLFYNSYNKFMKNIFGCKVYKVSIDGGFSCPNRDGTKGVGGCIYCDELGSSSRTSSSEMSITDQIINNIKVRKSRYRAEKFIAYFQSFSNTYAPVSELKKKYDEAINADKDIVGLDISTRPDCIDEEKIKLIASYKDKVKYVCVEYGMQTCHDKTLQLINRGETHKDFVKAIKLAQKYGLHHCAHVILGLPKETVEDQLITAQTLSDLQVEGIKIHLLVAMKNSALAEMYRKNLWKPLSYDEYISLACRFLEHIHPSCIIHRLSASGHPLHIIAPMWMVEKKLDIPSDISKEFQRRKTRQGYFC